jgi:hypothetical protein
MQKRRPRFLGANMPIGIYNSLQRIQYKAGLTKLYDIRTHAARASIKMEAFPMRY